MNNSDNWIRTEDRLPADGQKVEYRIRHEPNRILKATFRADQYSMPGGEKPGSFIPRDAASGPYGPFYGEWRPIEAPFVSTADALPKDGQRVEYKPDLNEPSAKATFREGTKSGLSRFQMDRQYVRSGGFSTGHFGIVPGYWRPLEATTFALTANQGVEATPSPELDQNDSTGILGATRVATRDEVGELSRKLDALIEAVTHINEGCIQHVDLTGDISKKLDATMNALHEMGNLEGSSPIVNMIVNQGGIDERLNDLEDEVNEIAGGGGNAGMRIDSLESKFHARGKTINELQGHLANRKDQVRHLGAQLAEAKRNQNVPVSDNMSQSETESLEAQGWISSTDPRTLDLKPYTTDRAMDYVEVELEDGTIRKAFSSGGDWHLIGSGCSIANDVKGSGECANVPQANTFWRKLPEVGHNDTVKVG